jgi:DNA-binding XRE family transcriptional regulator
MEVTRGQLLRRLRLSAGLNQAELAAIAEVSRQTIGTWERDCSGPNVTQWARILSVLIEIAEKNHGVRPWDLGRTDVNCMLNPLRERADTSPQKWWWWLSFCEATACRFLGAMFVEATNTVTALERASALGMNPGGEVAIPGPIRRERTWHPERIRREVLFCEEELPMLDHSKRHPRTLFVRRHRTDPIGQFNA